MRRAFSTRVSRLLVFIFVGIFSGFAAAQENYLVATQDGLLSLYDLATNTPLASMKAFTPSNIIPSPNNRLAFLLTGAYLSVVDTTIQHEVARLTDVDGLTAALTPDGKLLVVSCSNGWVRIVDTAQLKVARKVSVASVFGASRYENGAVVIAANKAYVFPWQGVLTNVAVIDLTTYAVSSIPLPSGHFPYSNLAAAMPDGQSIIALEREDTDVRYHALFIGTATDTIVADYPQSYDFDQVFALVITPKGSDPSKLFGYLGVNATPYGLEVVALDLRPGSQTFGQMLSSTAVLTLFEPDAVAINSDGTRLITVGEGGPLAPNTYVIDALKMINDPGNSIIAQVTVDNGMIPYTVSTGFFSTTPPNTAPVVSGVSGDITNDADHQIEITGGNFQPGALVRIGSMAPLPANVTGSSSLSVIVPATAPAGKAIDIVVTNPGAQGPQNQQNQSGLLAGQFDILLNLKFQPTTSFATVNLTDFSTSIYDFTQRAMVTVPPPTQWSYVEFPAFNLDGKEIYYYSIDALQDVGYVVPLTTSNNAWEAPIPANTSITAIAGSPDPTSGRPVINYVSQGYKDLQLRVIDSDPNSPTFHTTIRTWNAGLNANGVYVRGMQVPPDGRFAFIFYRTGYPLNYYLGTMDLTTGAFTYVNAGDLGVGGLPQQNDITMSLSPDGKSLFLVTVIGRPRIVVCDVSHPTHPKKLAQLTPVAIPGYGFPDIVSSRVEGNRLYAFDSQGIVVIFNFNKDTGDFRERGWYIDSNLSYGFRFNFEFSPDGQWLYVTDPIQDQITVLDPTRLLETSNVVVTTLRAPNYARLLAVSPVPPPSKAPVTAKPPATRSHSVRPSLPRPAIVAHGPATVEQE